MQRGLEIGSSSHVEQDGGVDGGWERIGWEIESDGEGILRRWNQME